MRGAGAQRRGNVILRGVGRGSSFLREHSFCFFSLTFHFPLFYLISFHFIFISFSLDNSFSFHLICPPSYFIFSVFFIYLFSILFFLSILPARTRGARAQGRGNCVLRGGGACKTCYCGMGPSRESFCWSKFSDRGASEGFFFS